MKTFNFIMSAMPSVFVALFTFHCMRGMEELYAPLLGVGLVATIGYVGMRLKTIWRCMENHHSPIREKYWVYLACPMLSILTLVFIFASLFWTPDEYIIEIHGGCFSIVFALVASSVFLARHDIRLVPWAHGAYLVFGMFVVYIYIFPLIWIYGDDVIGIVCTMGVWYFMTFVFGHILMRVSIAKRLKRQKINQGQT